MIIYLKIGELETYCRPERLILKKDIVPESAQ